MDVLRMKYFVVITSKRQLHPMYGVEKKLGKFRTVSTSGDLKFHLASNYPFLTTFHLDSRL